MVARASVLISLGLVVTACGGDDETGGDDAGELSDAGGSDAAAASCSLESEGELEARLTIAAALVPEDNCVLDPDSPTRSSGIMDLSMTDSYYLAVRIHNALETIAFVDGAIVALDVDGTCIPSGGRTDEFSAALTPMSSASVLFRAVEPVESQSLDGGEVQIVVAVEAGTEEATRIVSPSITFPIEICEGCLLNELGPCDSVEPPFADGGCYPGQDEPLDCCADGEGELQCPPP